MKKGISILLLLCLIFYHFGYYIIYFSHKHKIAAEWEERIHDENSKLQKVLEIPMKLPYSVDQNFQVTNISFKMDGKSYRGIKKRFNNGNFELVYVPDVATIKLELNLKKWIVSISSDGSEESGGDKILAKAFLSDFVRPLMELILKKYLFNPITDRGFLILFFENQVVSMDSPPPELNIS